MQKILIVLLLASTFTVSAQFGINGGFSTLKGFSPNKAYSGFHLGVEMPKEDGASLYLKGSYYFPRSGRDSVSIFGIARNDTTSPYIITVNGVPTMNFMIFEGGSRYYLGNGYDYGWAAYGGTGILLIFNKVRYRYDSFDETLYEIDAASKYNEGSVFSMSFGLSGGVKYSLAGVGTFYFDVNGSYALFGTTSVDGVYTGLYEPFIFSFNLGYRKDIGW